MSIFGRASGWFKPRVPTGLIGASLLILACEAYIDENALDYLGGAQWGYRVAAKVAATEAKDCGMLCFGDSLLKLGLAPKVVEAESGLRGYNLALAGGQPPGTFFLLRRALEAGARPRAIVVDFFPSMLATPPRFNAENWAVMTDLRDSVDLALAAGDPEEFARLTIPHWLPSVRCRATIRLKVQLALQATPFSIRVEILRALRNWKANRGAEITASKPDAVHDADTWERGFFGKFECLPVNLAYVERFLNLAASRDIPVFWTLPPYQPSLQTRTERSGFDARHEAFLRELQTRHPNLVVIDARHAGYEPPLFVDLHHLGREGAAAYSAEVGRTIHRHLCEPDSRSAWTTLARYQARPESAPLEDGAQSRMVVVKELQRQNLRTLRR